MTKPRDRRLLVVLVIVAAACVVGASRLLWVAWPSDPGLGASGEAGRRAPTVDQGQPSADGADRSAEARRAAPEVVVDDRVTAASPGDDSLLRIRTVTAEGEILAGCRIALKSTISLRGEMPYRHVLQEWEDGLHVARGLPYGDYDVMALVPNIKAPIDRVSWRREAKKDLTLIVASRFALIGGVVLDARNAGIANVELIDVGKQTQADFCVTDHRGRFLFCKLPETVELGAKFDVSSRRGAEVADSARSIELFWGNLACEVRAEDRAEVVVRLSDRSGNAIDDFTVHTETVFDGDCIQRTARAANGIARVRAVPTGRTRVLAVPNQRWRPVWGSVDVGPDGVGNVSLATDAAAELSGTVTSGGRVLSGAGVVARLEVVGEAVGGSVPGGIRVKRGPSDSPPIGVSAFADDGTFQFGCDPAATYRLQVTAPGYSPCQLVIAANEGVFRPVVVELSPTTTVRVMVTPPEVGDWLEAYAEQQGARVAGKNCCFALVQASPLPGTKREERIATPQVGGAFDFANVSAGKWLLWFRGPLKPSFVGEITVDVAGPTSIDAIDLESMRPGYLKGRVICESHVGRPILLSIGAGDGQLQIPLEASGRFEVALPSGDYHVRTRLERSSGVVDVTFSSRVHVQAGVEVPLELHVSSNGLQIRVVDNMTGEPLPGLRLSVDEDRAFGEFRVWTTDAAGEVTIEPCPLGTFGISLLASNQVWKHLQRLTYTGSGALVLRVQR